MATQEQFSVLLADHDEDRRGLLTRRLENLDFTVMGAGDGLAAVEIAEADQPDLILLDTVLSVLDGFETCQVLKELDPIADIPVVFLADELDPGMLVQGLGQGGVDFLVRPYVAEDLMQRLVMHLARGREQQTLMGVSMQRGIASTPPARESMLSARQRTCANARYSAVVQRSGALAGDVLAFHALESDHAGIAVLGVEGSGMGPTLLAASLYALLAPDADQDMTILEHRDGTPRDPADVLGILDEAFAAERTGYPFRLGYYLLDGRTGVFRYAGRAMPAPLRLGNDDEWLGDTQDDVETPDGDVVEDEGRLFPGELLLVPGYHLEAQRSVGGMPFGGDWLEEMIRDARLEGGSDPFDAVSTAIFFAMHRFLECEVPPVDVAAAILGLPDDR